MGDWRRVEVDAGKLSGSISEKWTSEPHGSPQTDTWTRKAP